MAFPAKPLLGMSMQNRFIRVPPAIFAAILLGSFWIPGIAWAQETVRGEPWNGPPGKSETVSEIMGRRKNDEPKPSDPPVVVSKGKGPHTHTDDPDAPRISQWPPKGGKRAQSGISAFSTDAPTSFQIQTLGTSFTGMTYAVSGNVPPSPVGAVGPSQIMVVVNGKIRTFLKTTGVMDGALDTTTNNFFTSVRNGQGTTDPRVAYDNLQSRWFVVMRNTAPTSNRILIAVSSGPTITSTSSFTFHYFQFDTVGSGTEDAGRTADFPTLGVDKFALYIGINVFNFSETDPGRQYYSSSAFVVNKSQLLSGSLVVTAFRRIAKNPVVFGTAGSAGPFTPIGVSNMNPNATEGYFIGTNTLTFNLRISRISNPGSTSVQNPPTLTALQCCSSPSLPSTTQPIHVPAQGSTYPLDRIDIRLVNAQMVDVGGVSSLWATHSIQVNASGIADTAGGRNGMRFYELRNLASQPVLNQAGTLYDSSATNPNYFWVGSLATSGQGHTALASSYAGNAAYAGVAITGRLASDAPGSLTMPASLTPGSGAYNLQTNPPDGYQRWGDYSSVVVDPTDNMTMWSFQEYTNAANSWGVLINQIKAPLPATPSSAIDSITGLPRATVGTTLNVTVTGTSSGGSGFFDPGSGFPNHISAAVNGGGVTVNSVTYMNPTQIVLNLTIASNAATTARTITVTNPDGQSVTSASAIFTIDPPSSPITILTSSPLPNGTVGVPYSQTISVSGGIAPYTFTILSGALPAGLTLSSSTGAITGTPATSGVATFTIKVTDSLNSNTSTLYSHSISTLLTSTVALPLESTSYDGTTWPPYVGRFTLNTRIVNNGAPITTPIYFKITSLAKLGGDQNPSVPNKLLTADNQAGVAGDIQTLNIGSLGTGVSAPVPLTIGIGSRQTFTISVDVYTTLSGSAITAADSGFGKGSPETATSPSTMLLGQFTFKGGEVLIPEPPDSLFQNPDPLSNLGVLTGSGAQSRPAAAVDPLMPNRIAIAANDYAVRGVKVSTTEDGGKTWRTTMLSRTAGNLTFYSAQNPSLAFDSLGRLSVVYTLSNLADSAGGVVISESTDGLHFSPPAPISLHPASERIVDSRPTIAVRQGTGRYVAWDSFSVDAGRYNIRLARSPEGGLFEPPITVAANVLATSPALALDRNTVYIGWNEWGYGRLVMTSSATNKLKFDEPREIAKASVGFARRIPAMPEQGAGPNLSLAVDPRNEGSMYAVFADGIDGMKILVARSRNGGLAWQVKPINDQVRGADQFSPAVAVDADGNLKVAYYDTQLSGTFESAHVFLARSSRNSDTFDIERLTTISSNDSKSNPFRDSTANLGDKTAIAITDADVLVVWTDTRLGSEDIFTSVVFDPQGQAVTGAGKIASPAGAFPSNVSLRGTVEFGFQAKYRKFDSVPTGDLEIRFEVGKDRVQFRSASYDWLTVRDARLRLKGHGKMNGTGEYVFLATAVDGRRSPDGARFRIKIVDETTGAVVYDNVPGAPDDIDTASLPRLINGEIQIRN